MITADTTTQTDHLGTPTADRPQAAIAPAEQTPADSASRARGRLPFALAVVAAAILTFGAYAVAVPLSLIPGLEGLVSSSTAAAIAVTCALSVVTLLTAIGLTALATRLNLRGRLADVGLLWTRHSAPLFLLGWAAAAVALVAGQLIPLLAGVDERVPVDPEAWASLTVWIVIGSIVMTVFQAIALQGLPEELIWRGWLMRSLSDRPRLVLIVSAVGFSLLHFASQGGQESPVDYVLYVVQAGAFGFCGGALALRMRSLWAAIGVHAGFHLTMLVLQLTPLSAAGPVTWGATAAVFIALGCAALAGWRGDRVEYIR